MLAADIGQKTMCRSGKSGKQFHFTGMVYSHFNHSHLVFAAKAEKRQGDTKMIIEISFAHMNPVTAPEYRGRHFLGRGFSVAPANPDKRDIEFQTVAPCKLLQCLHGIVDHKIPLPSMFPRRLLPVVPFPGNNRTGRAFLESLMNEVMPVRRLSL